MSSEAQAAKMFADDDLGPDGWRQRDIRASLELIAKLHDEFNESNDEVATEKLWYLFEVIAGLAGEQLEEDALLSHEANRFLTSTVSQWIAEYRETFAV